MDAITLLTADHNRVRGLFTRFRDAQESDDEAAMAELADKICTELEVHTTIEEEIFYPNVREGSQELRETVDEGLQEHHVVDVLMNELRELEAGSDDWVAKVTVITENVEHHAEEEEKEMFPQVRKRFDSSTLESLASELEARKAALGAPVLKDKADLSKQELLDLAREQQIPGRSKMDHEQLAATVAPG